MSDRDEPGGWSVTGRTVHAPSYGFPELELKTPYQAEMFVREINGREHKQFKAGHEEAAKVAYAYIKAKSAAEDFREKIPERMDEEWEKKWDELHKREREAEIALYELGNICFSCGEGLGQRDECSNCKEI